MEIQGPALFHGNFKCRLGENTQVAKKKPNQPNPHLRSLHAQGKRFLAESDRLERRGEGSHGTMATKAETRTEKNRRMEARKFARLYNDQELNWICSLGQSKGRPLTRVDVLQLIRLPDRRKRNALAKKCSEEKWTVRKLEMEVRLIAPRRKYGGRRQTRPRSVEEALLVTERMAASWMRWISVLRPDEVNNGKRQITIDQLPKPTQTKLKKVTDEFESLRAELSRQLDSKQV
jgi:hypothetical protein